MKTINYGFHASDLFDGLPETTDLYDHAESADRYAEQLKTHLQVAHPGAEITVPYDTDAGGALSSPLQCRYNGVTAAEAATDDMTEIGYIEQMAQTIYTDFRWMVPTSAAMMAAHYVRQVDFDGTLADLDNADKAAAQAGETGDDPTRARERYDFGRRTLKVFTLTYSPRYQRGTPHPQIPDDVAGWITISAGHIATAEAQRLALFRPRN